MRDELSQTEGINTKGDESKQQTPVRTDDSGQNKTDCNLTREQKHGLDREQKQTQIQR